MTVWSAPAAQGTGRARSDTRARILEVALGLFAERGYAGTSIRDIAEELGVTKAAVHYHFAAKEQLVLALVEPVLAALAEAVDRCAAGPADPSRMLLELHDLLVRTGPLLAVLTSDPSVGHAAATLHAQFEAQGDRAARVLAGPAPSAARLLRAHCALAAFVGGWKHASGPGVAPGGGSPVREQDLQAVLDAALAALGEDAAPA